MFLNPGFPAFVQIINFRLLIICFHLLIVVCAPVPKITIKGGDHVRHFQGVPYVDVGAEVTVTLADETTKIVQMETISTTVPAGCETLGQYEIQY